MHFHSDDSLSVIYSTHTIYFDFVCYKITLNEIKNSSKSIFLSHKSLSTLKTSGSILFTKF